MLPAWPKWLLFKCCLFASVFTFFLVFQQGVLTQSLGMLVYFENLSYPDMYLFSFPLPWKNCRTTRWNLRLSLFHLNVWIISVIAVQEWFFHEILLASFLNPLLRIRRSVSASGKGFPTFFCSHSPACWHFLHTAVKTRFSVLSFNWTVGKGNWKFGPNLGGAYLTFVILSFMFII